MLETVLEIGRVLRAAPDGLKHHRYVKRAPVPDEKNNPVKFWLVPTENDGSFDFARLKPLNDENRQKRLFYLNYKQGDADSTKRYLYGDIYRSVTKIGEDGNFRFGDPAKRSWMALNSFLRAEDTNALATNRVKRFRDAFREQLVAIENFLNDYANTYIHFDFEGKGWHELEEMVLLNRSILETFFEKTEHGYVMSTFLFKTLAAGTSRVPGFQAGSEYRCRVFKDENEAMDLLYGVNYASRSTLRKHDIKVVILPRGDNLTARQIERFFERNATVEPNKETEAAEEEIRTEIKSVTSSQTNEATSSEEEMFDFLRLDDEQDEPIAQFDFIFSKAGGTQADIDMIELAGLERSNLWHISRYVQDKRNTTQQERAEFLQKLYGKPPKKAPASLRIAQSFLNVLGDTTRAKKKYQSHLLHVLPQIYTGCYFQDPVLLPALIEKTEFNIRNDVANFNLLKFDFYFLARLQNYGGDRLMDIKNSPSYQVGLLLGKLAKQFSGPDTPIKSFEKNYVGLLSRRITTLDDVIKFANDVNQKLIMHDRAGFTFRTSTELAQAIKGFPGRYDKDECAFGFFESYFAPLPPRKDAGDKSSDTEPTLDLQSTAE